MGERGGYAGVLWRGKASLEKIALGKIYETKPMKEKYTQPGPKISIIVANYNNDIYLDDCLRSVATQSFADFECIVVDDGSTDGSRDIINRWARRDKRFIPVFQKNRGVSAARNVGMDMARGKWIGFLDADDCFCADGLKILYECGEQNSADIVGGGGVRVPDDFKLRDSATSNFTNPPFILLSFNMVDMIKMEYLGETHRLVWVWRRLFRREIVKNVRFDENLYPGEDTCFIYEALPHAQRIVECRGMVVYHRMARRSVSAAPFNQKSFQWIVPTMRRLRWIMDTYYPASFHRHFYHGYLDMIVFDIVCRSLGHGRMMTLAAQHLGEIYGTNVLPTKYLAWHKRFILWLYMKVFG